MSRVSSRRTAANDFTNAALRTIDAKGGFDPVILKAKDEVLSIKALKIKRQLKAKLAETAAA